MTVQALPAATVVLVRERPGTPGTLETFLLRRAAGSAFLAGAHVFPGGRVDPDDREPAWLGRLEGLDRLESRLRDRIDGPAVLAHAVAAAREVFEETGILLGRIPAADATFHDATALAVARSALLAGRASFSAWCADHHLRLTLDGLLPWAHWITPDTEARRFDTWFFLALTPADQDASVVPGEASEGAWISTGDALARHAHGEIALAPPTLRTLEEIAAHESWASLLASSSGRPLTPVLPRVVREGSRPVLVLPGDRDYGDDTPRGVEGPTRFVLAGQRWTSAP